MNLQTWKQTLEQLVSCLQAEEAALLEPRPVNLQAALENKARALQTMHSLPVACLRSVSADRSEVEWLLRKCTRLNLRNSAILAARRSTQDRTRAQLNYDVVGYGKSGRTVSDIETRLTRAIA